MDITASPKKRLLLLGGCLIFLAGVGGLVLACYQSKITDVHIEAVTRVWVLYFAALIALVGWVVTAYISLYNSTKQHTINILLQSRLSNTFQDYRAKVLAIYSEYPQLVAVPLSDIEKLRNRNLEPEKVVALESMKYLLNYY